MKCEICPQQASVHVTWGLYSTPGPKQEADLCSACSDSLWSRVKGAVNALLMHWTNRHTQA